MTYGITYHDIQDVYTIPRWDSGEKFCIRIVINEGSLLIQVSRLLLLQLWMIEDVLFVHVALPILRQPPFKRPFHDCFVSFIYYITNSYRPDFEKFDWLISVCKSHTARESLFKARVFPRVYLSTLLLAKIHR